MQTQFIKYLLIQICECKRTCSVMNELYEMAKKEINIWTNQRRI
jgi:hypothetical protein